MLNALELVLQIKTAIEDYRRQLQASVTELVIELLHRIIGDMTPGLAVAAAAQQALPTLDLDVQVTLLVGSEAFAEVGDFLSAHLDNETAAKIHLREEPEFAPMQARIESRFGSIDLSLDRQLELLAGTLRSANIGIEG
jgi:flagellar biosynthesis/type III secretory pathway protein FliH